MWAREQSSSALGVKGQLFPGTSDNYDSCRRAEDAPWYLGNRVANELSSSSPPGLSSFEKGSTFLRSTQASRHLRARVLWQCAAAHAPVVYSVVVPGLLFAELSLLALRRWGASLAVCRHGWQCSRRLLFCAAAKRAAICECSERHVRRGADARQQTERGRAEVRDR
jgi:hypothetical protein